MKSLTYTLLFLALPLFTHAQHKKEVEKFKQNLIQMGAEVMPPLDGDYKELSMAKNLTQNCQWAIKSRKNRLEIRFLTQPEVEGGRMLAYPDVASHRLAMHICSNEQNAGISVRDMTQHEMEDLFNADWGRVYIFPPKLDFSENAYCKMVALQKAGKGMAYIFYLFDEPSQAIDNSLYSFRFLSEAELEGNQ